MEDAVFAPSITMIQPVMTSAIKSRAVIYALFLNAALLLAIFVTLLTHGRGSFTPAAFGDQTQIPIAGGPTSTGGSVYVMPCQFHPNVWGCYLLDTDQQTLCAYEYQAGEKALVLTAARNYKYDLALKNYNTFPAWYDIKKAVEDAAHNGQTNESRLPSVQPEAPKDNP